MIKNIIFDFDGVIVDSASFHLKYLAEWNPDLPITEQEFYDKHLGNTNLPEEVTNFNRIDWIAYKKFIYDKEIKQELSVDCRNFIEQNADTKQLSIVSSAQEPNIHGFSNYHSLENIFNPILGKESGLSKVKKLQTVIALNGSLDEYVFITDTVGDIKESQEVGLRVIAVDFGYHTRGDLEAANPYAVCSSWAEIQVLINEM